MVVAAVVAVAVVAMALGACDSPEPILPEPTRTARPADREQLAGLAAAAKDRRYVATYTLVVPKRPERTVTVAVATDGTWVVGIPGGALSGLADIAIFRSAQGLFHCSLGPVVGAYVQRPDLDPIMMGCVRVDRLTGATDPRVQHLFTDWIDPLVDRATALSVAATGLLPGAVGSCYSIESNSAALAPPVDPGIYCYQRDGLLTAARVGFGTLTLTGAVAPAPPSIAIPASVVSGDPLPVTAPPPPPPPPSPSPSP